VLRAAGAAGAAERDELHVVAVPSIFLRMRVQAPEQPPHDICTSNTTVSCDAKSQPQEEGARTEIDATG